MNKTKTNKKLNTIYKNSILKPQSQTLKNKKSIPNQMLKKDNKDFTFLKKNDKNEWIYMFYNSADDDTLNNNKNSKGNKPTNPMNPMNPDKSKKIEPNKVKRCMCIDYKTMNDFKTYDRCKNNAVNNTDFCDLHQNCKSYLRNFLSGYEPEYQPQLWSDPYIEGSHNCYSYFLNRQVKAVTDKCVEICEKKHKSSCPKKDSECSDLKPQPGDYDYIKNNGTTKGKERIYQCPNMQKKILKDNPSIRPITFNEKCPNNFYKGALTVDPNSTFHFYKEDKDATWSHKPGISSVKSKDASGNTIYVPHFADRNYENDDKNDDDQINYKNFCGYYCIPQNKTIHKNLA